MTPCAAISPRRNWPISPGPSPLSTRGTASPSPSARRRGGTSPRRTGERGRRIIRFADERPVTNTTSIESTSGEQIPLHQPPPNSESDQPSPDIEVASHASGIEETCRRLVTHPQRGLSDSRAAELIKRLGYNELQEKPPEPWWKRLGR